MNISRGRRCPLHKSYYCCGRKPSRREFKKTVRTRPRYGEPDNKKWVQVRPGEWHIPDPHHARGYRVRLSKSRMEQVLLVKVTDQDGKCCICGERFESLKEVTPDHKGPSSMGGAWRDDHSDNIGAAHGRCNCRKGSKRLIDGEQAA